MKEILVVNPNLINGEQISTYLANDYTVTLARTTEEMSKILRDKAKFFDAIILDVNDDVVREFEVLKKIHCHALYRQIPIIVTLEFDATKIQKSMSLGALGYVTYPISKQLLLSTINNLIEMRERVTLENTFKMDELTNLPRKAAFFHDAEIFIRKKKPGFYILSCVDIENFKIINDQYGFEIGDDVLRHVGKELKDGANALNGICFRHSADKFGILYPASLKDSDLTKNMYLKIISNNPTGRNLKIRVGRYLIDDFSISISAMFDRATLAEETIKGRYDNYIVEYSSVMRNALINEQKIVNDMNDALLNNEFEPWFQPQYNHATGAIIGAEALVRWKKNDTYIFPSDFIPVFERNGFIYQMDQYIWESVCKLLRKWLDDGISPLPISVNVSRRDLFHQHFIDVFTGIVKKYDIPYNLLRIEVTESAFAEASGEIIKKVGDLIKLGFTVEIDDFGSGYSSLNTLKDVPAAILKLDMRFFEKKGDKQRGGNIIESVVRMAKWLGMAVIAEGVEKKEQADFLKSIGCYYIQGYFYSKPIPLNEFEKILYKEKKESDLTRLRTIKNLNNNDFWNPNSMETLIFNSYVGGACIFEYHNGKTELLRVNDQYAQELRGLVIEGKTMHEASAAKFLDQENERKMFDNIHKAIESERESTTELKLEDTSINPSHIEYVRITVRVIASTEERYLLYCVIVNTTDTHLLEEKRLEAEKRQLESSKRLEVIISNINGGVSALNVSDDFNYNFIFTNEKYYELYGYTKKEIEEKKINIIYTILPEDRKMLKDRINQMKNDKKSSTIDYCCIKKDGKKAFLRANSSVMNMEGYGEVIASVVIDITEQKEMSDKFKAVIDNISGGVSATYMNGDKLEYAIINDKYYELVGYTKTQFKKEVKDIFELIHPDDKERVRKQFKEANKSQKPYRMEYRFTSGDGKIKYVECNTNFIHLFGIEAPVQLAVSTDVTRLQMAQQKEEEDKEKFEILINKINVGISVIVLSSKEKATVLFRNDKYYEIIGYSKKNHNVLTKKSALAIVHKDDCKMVEQEIVCISKTKKGKEIEFRIINEKKETVMIKANIEVTDFPGITSPVLICSLQKKDS